MSEQEQEEECTVKETRFSEYDTGFIAGVLAAWGVIEPTEVEYRVAMDLLVAQGKALES
ncbi:MAG: hypothetical protein ABIQ86_12755 [Steroidobacteraceae bacterium]